MSAAARKPPWKRKNPRKRSKKLTTAQKATARASAQRAGRRYPNLVDNMRAAAKKKSTTKRKRSTKRVKKRAGKRKKTEDPHGGLTAAGREAFARSEGAHLRPGVKKKAVADMTPQEMRRKGSWAVRFYGRRGALPPLRDAKGKPTRFALTAAAWGEPVPRTATAARKIAARGRALLARYERTKKG